MLAAAVIEDGAEAVGGNLKAVELQVREVVRGVGIDHGVEGDLRVVVHPHGLDFVRLLHALRHGDGAVAVGRGLHGDLPDGVADAAAVALRVAAHRNDGGLGEGCSRQTKQEDNWCDSLSHFIICLIVNIFFNER